MPDSSNTSFEGVVLPHNISKNRYRIRNLRQNTKIGGGSRKPHPCYAYHFLYHWNVFIFQNIVVYTKIRK